MFELPISPAAHYSLSPPPPIVLYVCLFVCLFVCSELSVDPLDPHSMVKRTFGENGPPVGYDLEDDAPTF